MNRVTITSFDNQKPTRQELYPYKLYSKIEGNNSLCNKKALFANLKEYYLRIGQDPYSTLPITFHIKEGVNEASFFEFRRYYERNVIDGVNVWIVKPGENANRGSGIQVVKNFREIKQII